MDNDEQWNQFLKALAEVQKQNDLIIKDMVTSYIKNQLNINQ